jgi:hypothetical protein
MRLCNARGVGNADCEGSGAAAECVCGGGGNYKGR